jgi:PPOX class probable F420-dependent enzyme
MFTDVERRYVEAARVARLATADTDARPHVVPICFALLGDHLVTAIDEKPQQGGPESLRRSRDTRENPNVAVVVDHYTEDWDGLGWVQIRGTASHRYPDEECHSTGVRALREKYDQYGAHDLENRPLIDIEIRSILSWGDLSESDSPSAGQ